jgi:glycosyltransferase involved in cell wall biosynthesis
MLAASLPTGSGIVPVMTTSFGLAVLVYDVDPRGGGMERQAVRLARALSSRAHDVRLLLATQPGLFRLPRRGFRDPEEGLPALRAPLAAYELVAGASLVRTRARWHVLYAVGLTMGVIGARMAAALDRPLVLKLACGGEHGDAHALQSRRDGDRLLRSLLGRVVRFVCPSEEIEREWRELGVEPARLVRIPNGVELARFPTRPRGPRSGRARIVFVGRLDRQKRPDVLVRAFARAKTDAELVLVGGGERAAEIESLARELGVGARTSLLGPRSDVPELLSSADLFVLPSAGEGVSNALLEALASGVPAIATAIAPNREVLEDGTGLLVPLDDEAALASAIERVLGDPELAARLGAAGRARVERAYDLARVADAYERVFAEAAAAPVRERSTARLAARVVAARLGCY